MDSIINDLVTAIVTAYHGKPSSPVSRFVIGIAGLPGSGKSTVAVPVVDGINRAVGAPLARCVGLDGWHLARAELDKFPDAAEAHFRRGAPFTFDVADYARFVNELHINFSTPIPFPTFEHVKKDPVPSPEPIQPAERIIVIEGLYTLLGDGDWLPIAESLDMGVFVHIDREVARQRCIERNWAARLTSTKEETIRRVDNSDMVNGDLVLHSSITPTKVVNVVEDEFYILM